jgi:hypothetical protein
MTRRVVPTVALKWLGATFFVVVHLVLIAENLSAPNQPLGDVTYTYPLWIAEAMTSGLWPGLTADGVYPFLALLGPISLESARSPFSHMCCTPTRTLILSTSSWVHSS